MDIFCGQIIGHQCMISGVLSPGISTNQQRAQKGGSLAPSGLQRHAVLHSNSPTSVAVLGTAAHPISETSLCSGGHAHLNGLTTYPRWTHKDRSSKKQNIYCSNILDTMGVIYLL